MVVDVARTCAYARQVNTVLARGRSARELSQAGYHRQAGPSSEETMSGAKPGSHVAVARAGGLYDHHAIYVGNACVRSASTALARDIQSVSLR